MKCVKCLACLAIFVWELSVGVASGVFLFFFLRVGLSCKFWWGVCKILTRMRQYQFLVQANLFILLFLADLRIVTGEKDTSLSTTVSKAKSKLNYPFCRLYSIPWQIVLSNPWIHDHFLKFRNYFK